MHNTVVLIVLDGWGIGPKNDANAIYKASPSTIEYINNNFPSGSLQSSGISVGLPWGEEGNSEVGHLTMGVGRVIYQHYPRISLSIKDKTFSKNDTILNALKHAKDNNSKIHFIGLVGEANVHSSMEHLGALIAMAQREQVSYVIHPITDGRDSPPQAAYRTLKQLSTDHIGSIAGRYYAMDRDKHWNLTQQAYQAIIGNAPILAPEDIQQHLQNTYRKNLNDEYIVPASINPTHNAVANNDALFFFNFREDRMRQLGAAFIDPSFDQFPTTPFENLHIASMTQIHKTFDIPVAFPPQVVHHTLGSVLADHNKTQLRVAETQKYAHVTFFFNGLRDKPYKNEYRVLVPSQTVTRQDEHPEMMAEEITTRITQAMQEKGFDFILANYANPDMIAHTGNFDATVQAINTVNAQLERVLQAAFKNNATLLITSDHGNAERLFDPITGEKETKHDANPVPIYLVGAPYYRPRTAEELAASTTYTTGLLSDIAPTILDLMKLPAPEEMTGTSLLETLI
jgi:2,3-bisphosphoglycerate-independent phosphoglycerate mutase